MSRPMFRKITVGLGAISSEIVALRESLDGLSAAIQEPTDTLALLDRVSALEGELEKVFGRVDAALMKAEGSKHAARNAEERSRGMEKRARELVESVGGAQGGEEEDPFEAALRQESLDPEGNGAAYDEAGMSPMQPGLGRGTSGLQRVRDAKRRGQ